MTFRGKTKIQSPRKETVWVPFQEEKEEAEGAVLHSRPRSGCGDGSTDKGRNEQPKQAADLRPLGERAEHAAQYYHAGEQRDPVEAAEDGRNANQSHPRIEEGEPKSAA